MQPQGVGKWSLATAGGERREVWNGEAHCYTWFGQQQLMVPEGLGGSECTLCSHAFLVFIQFLSDFVLLILVDLREQCCQSGSSGDLSFASCQPLPVFHRLWLQSVFVRAGWLHFTQRPCLLLRIPYEVSGAVFVLQMEITETQVGWLVESQRASKQ